MPKKAHIPRKTCGFGLFLNALKGFESKVIGFRCIFNFISFLEKEKSLWQEGGMFNIPCFGSLMKSRKSFLKQKPTHFSSCLPQPFNPVPRAVKQFCRTRDTEGGVGKAFCVAFLLSWN